MRISDRLVLQKVSDEQMVLVDTDSSEEIVLSLLEAGRLFAGIEWFSFTDSTLASAIVDATVIRDTTRAKRAYAETLVDTRPEAD